MDPIAHTLIGVQLGRSGPLDRVRERVWLLVFASLIPDIDFVAARLTQQFFFSIVQRRPSVAILDDANGSRRKS